MHSFEECGIDRIARGRTDYGIDPAEWAKFSRGNCVHFVDPLFDELRLKYLLTVEASAAVTLEQFISVIA
jgi:hypothetical protein